MATLNKGSGETSLRNNIGSHPAPPPPPAGHLRAGLSSLIGPAARGPPSMPPVVPLPGLSSPCVVIGLLDYSRKNSHDDRDPDVLAAQACCLTCDRASPDVYWGPRGGGDSEESRRPSP